MAEPVKQICEELKEIDGRLASLRAKRRALIAELEGILEKELPSGIYIDVHLIEED